MPNRWICLTAEEQLIITAWAKSAGWSSHGNPSEQKKSKKLENALIKKMNAVDKTISVSSRKGKGRNLQYWLCDKISKLINIKWVQADDSCLIHSREMGQHGTDIVLRRKALKKFPFSIECKSTETLSLIKTIQQAEANTAAGTDMLIVHKCKALKSPIVIVFWDTFEKLFKEAHNHD